MAEIHFFVCRNGFGHQKRVLTVIYELVLVNPSIKIYIHCHQFTFEKTKNWPIAQKLLNKNTVVFEFECMNDAPEYLNGSTLNSVKKWLDKIEPYTKNYNGLKVVDNDASLLQIFNDAIMMGSFIWSDVLVSSAEKQDFVIFEKSLIQKHQPIFMGVHIMAMPFVKDNKNFSGFPWFCNAHPLRDKNILERNSVLVTGGGTNFSQNSLVDIARQLVDNGENVYVDQQLFNFSKYEFKQFGFQDFDFLNVKAVFCRPGMGILNDCISYGIPIFAVEDENPELMHNGFMVQKLNLGQLISKDKSLNNVKELLKIDNLVSFHQTICSQKTEGATLVAKHINNLLLNGRQ